MEMDEHDDHRRGGFGCFPVLLGFFIGVAATLAAMILLGLWANQDSPPSVEPRASVPLGQLPEPAPSAAAPSQIGPPESPLLTPDGAPVTEDAPDTAEPTPAPEAETPTVKPAPSPAPPPVRAAPARPAPAPRRAPAPAVRAPPPAAKPQSSPRAAQPRDRIEDDAAASGLTSRSRR